MFQLLLDAAPSSLQSWLETHASEVRYPLLKAVYDVALAQGILLPSNLSTEPTEGIRQMIERVKEHENLIRGLRTGSVTTTLAILAILDSYPTLATSGSKEDRRILRQLGLLAKGKFLPTQMDHESEQILTQVADQIMTWLLMSILIRKTLCHLHPKLVEGGRWAYMQHRLLDLTDGFNPARMKHISESPKYLGELGGVLALSAQDVFSANSEYRKIKEKIRNDVFDLLFKGYDQATTTRG